MIVKLFPRASFLPYLYMSLPLFIMEPDDLGFKNYGRGLLWGSLLLPLLILFPPSGACYLWVANQTAVSLIEEIYFRGYLMRELGNVRTSALFSLAHLINFPTLNSLLVFFPSLLFGYAYQRSGSILAPFMLHLSSNLFSFGFYKEFPELYHLLNRYLTGS